MRLVNRQMIKKFQRSLTARQIHFWALSIIVSVGVFSYLFSQVSLAEIVNLIQKVSLRWIFLFVLFSFSMSLFSTWRYQILLRVSGCRTNSIALFLVTLVRNFFADLLPARLGTLIYVYLVRTRLGIPFGPAMSSFAHALIFDVVSLSLLVVFALFSFHLQFQSMLMMLGAGIMLLLFSMVLLAMLPTLCSLAEKALTSAGFLPELWRQRLREGLGDTKKHLLLARSRDVYWKILVLSFAVRCSKYISLYVLLLALVIPLGYTVSAFTPAKVFFGLVSAELAASLPISGIAGFGAYEGTWSLVFQLLGYPETIAVLTGISHHLFTQVYGYGLGGLAMLFLLLPFFSGYTKKQRPVDLTPNPGFWWRFILVTAVIALCAVLPLFGSGHLHGNTAGDSKAFSESGVPEVAKPAAKVVYQRSDGIYLTDIVTNYTFRLTVGGTYPRWSPDGSKIVFVRDGSIMVIAAREQAQARQVAHTDQARAVCFGSDGITVLYTDGDVLQEVDLQTGLISVVAKDGDLREVDISSDGRYIAVTAKTITGFTVRIFDRQSGDWQTVAGGCSASLSPDGGLVTVNAGNHRELLLYDRQNRRLHGRVKPPQDRTFDNQFWSNRPDWLVSTMEGDAKNILLHHIPTGQVFQLTTSGDCDRGDIYITASPLSTQ